MGATTRFGLRWMEGTDRLNQVAQAIRNLAEDVESKLYARGDLSTADQADVSTDETTTNTTVGSALATAGPAVTFLAPASGKARVDWTVRASNSTAAGQAIVTFELVANDGGAGALGHSAVRAVRVAGTAQNTGSAAFLVTGLTPGKSYTARMGYSTNSSNTATIGHRRLLVTPS